MILTIMAAWVPSILSKSTARLCTTQLTEL